MGALLKFKPMQKVFIMPTPLNSPDKMAIDSPYLQNIGYASELALVALFCLLRVAPKAVVLVSVQLPLDIVEILQVS